VLKIGFCGDDCNYCPKYLATQSGDEERLKEVAVMWQMIGWPNPSDSPGDMTCHGCTTVNICGLGIRECVMEKGVENCGKCPDYPCERLSEIFENNEREAGICKANLREKDYKLFQQAFFSKKERLDKINKG